MAAEPAFWFVFCCPGDGCAALGRHRPNHHCESVSNTERHRAMREGDEPAAPRISTRPLKPAPCHPDNGGALHPPAPRCRWIGRGPARCLVSASSRAIDETWSCQASWTATVHEKLKTDLTRPIAFMMSTLMCHPRNELGSKRIGALWINSDPGSSLRARRAPPPLICR
jgi:hypothetical protein